MWSVEKYLMEDEYIIFEKNPTWFAYLPLYFSILLFLPLVFIFPFFAFLIILFLYLMIILDQKSTKYVLTNRNLMKRSGIISESLFSVRLEEITSLAVQQSTIGKIIDHGDLIVDSRGTGDHYEFILKKIKKPEEVRRIIKETQLKLLREEKERFFA